MLGMISYECCWSLIRATIMLLTALALGVTLHVASLPAALLALVLTLAAYFGIGVALAGMILVFRTTGPLGSGMLAASALLGGAYYSTAVIPSWIQQLSAIIPLTYGLRAFRQALLGGAPFRGSRPRYRHGRRICPRDSVCGQSAVSGGAQPRAAGGDPWPVLSHAPRASGSVPKPPCCWRPRCAQTLDPFIRSLAGPHMDWTRFLQLVAHERAEAIVAPRLARVQADVPPEALAELKAIGHPV